MPDVPTAGNQKEQYVERLFTHIAPRYDLLNSLLSFNQHKYWRKFAARKCRLSPGDSALDVATGTLDFAFELAKAVGLGGKIVGVDFCRPMLEIGQGKLDKRRIRNITLIEGNAEHLPVQSDSFDAATIGFALRNVASVENTLTEMVRVVKPGGRVVSLEFSQPKGLLFPHLYKLYSSHVLPLVGGTISGSKDSYEYLPDSVKRFYSREELSRIMQKVGLGDIKVYNLTGGIVAVHIGTKK